MLTYMQQPNFLLELAPFCWIILLLCLPMVHAWHVILVCVHEIRHNAASLESSLVFMMGCCSKKNTRNDNNQQSTTPPVNKHVMPCYSLQAHPFCRALANCSYFLGRIPVQSAYAVEYARLIYSPYWSGSET